MFVSLRTLFLVEILKIIINKNFKSHQKKSTELTFLNKSVMWNTHHTGNTPKIQMGKLRVEGAHLSYRTEKREANTETSDAVEAEPKTTARTNRAEI